MKRMFIRNASQKSWLIFFTLTSCALVVWLLQSIPQGLWSDPGWQLVAVKQHLAGESATFNHRVEPQWGDLSKDYSQWTFWWPPAPQLFTYLLMKNGMSTGDALRLIVIACLIIGSLAWAQWFNLFRLPLWIKITLAVSLPWLYYPQHSRFWYSPEIFAYAMTPWLLLATYKFSLFWIKGKSGPRMTLISALLGLALGSVYLLKFSAVLTSLGIIAYLGLVVYQIFKTNSRASKENLKLNFILLVIFFLIPVIAQNLLNYEFSHNFNRITETLGLNLRPENFIDFISFPVLTIASAESSLYYIYCELLHPAQGIVPGTIWLGIIGLPGGLLFWWLILNSGFLRKKRVEILAIVVSSVAYAAMLFIWTLTPLGASYHGRFFLPASMAVFPYIIRSAISAYKHTKVKAFKIFLLLSCLVYVIMPLAVAPHMVIKQINMPRNYITGPSGIYNPSLAHSNMPAVLSQLQEDYNPATDVWFLPDPISALDIPGRAIIEHVNYTDLSTLQRQKFFSYEPRRIHALIPAFCEKNGKAQAIRASFIQAQEWSKKELADSDYICWTTTLKIQR